QGLAECAGAFGASLAGGNLSAAATPVLTSTCLGSVPAGQALRRAGAGAGWELAVSGRLGGAAAGLRSLDDSSPWRAAWRRRLARPEPRLGVGRIIREAGVRVALDVSDGLYLDASRLLEAGAGDMPSGLLLDAAAIPVEAGVAEAWPADVWVLVGGGEDYEVLFAAPPEVMRQALARIRAAGADATVIGRFDEGRGVRLLIDGREAPPPGAGHEHFASTARG
ncbi:MAG TPA: thiamine-phosphate kinase, partial [Candidatus Dormibacteraeota bacterium]|nr:thiamine-phosphate kinase [Candidatus Dormibacteraeota bacterium]